jgi:transposase InsO family protein
VRPTRPNQWLSFDFLYVSAADEAAEGYTHILTVVDMFSKYVMLTPTKAADTASAANAILKWFANFGVATNFLSDRGSHFTSQLFASLTGTLGIEHHFTCAWAPQSHGLVERQNREVLYHLRTISSEARLTVKDWPTLVPLVQGIMNATPSKLLDGHPPITVHCGLPASNPLSSVFLPDAADFTYTRPLPSSVHRHVERLRDTILDLHSRIGAAPQPERRGRPGEQPINWTVGDFCLVSSQHGAPTRDKTQSPWHGPYRVVAAINDHVFKVEDLVTGATKDVHAMHLKYYSDKTLTVTPQLLKFAAHACQGHIVTAITDHKLRPAPARVLVHWAGYAPEEATWEPLATIYDTNPRDVRRYVNSLADKAARKQLSALLTTLASADVE